MKKFVYLLLLLFAPQVFGGPFDPPPGDESVALLGLIFGSNVGDIYLQGGNANPVLYQMIAAFNNIIIDVGIAVVSYVGIVSTINTAQEGEILGKKWSAVWVPLRAIIGMCMLIPTPATGYSLIQMTVMYIVLQGVGAADYIWTAALEGVRNNASPSTGQQVDPNIAQAANDLAKEILYAAVCVEAFHKMASEADHTHNNDWMAQHGTSVNIFAEKDPVQLLTFRPDAQGFRTASVYGSTYFGIQGSSSDVNKAACGKLVVQGVASLQDYKDATKTSTTPDNQELLLAATKLYEAKQSAISDMYNVLKPLAQAIVDGTLAGTYVPPNNKGEPPPSPAGYAKSAHDVYTQYMVGVTVPTDTQTTGTGVTDPLTQALNTGEQTGWVTAGAYYFILNKSVYASTYADAKIAPSPPPGNDIVIHDCDDVCISNAYSTDPKASSKLTTASINPVDAYQMTDADKLNFTKALAYAAVYMKYDNAPAGLNFSSDLAGYDGVNTLVQVFGGWLIQPIMQSFMGMLANVGSSGDPLIAHATFGRDMMLVCEFVWVALIGAAIVTTIWSYLPLGAGSGPSATSFAIILVIMGVILPVIGTFWAIGASLAIYAPLIPYMIFAMGVVGWLLLVVEGVIAAPVVALGLVVPSGDEMGKLEHALNLLANIFLRPVLMIFGFILAGRVYAAIVNLICFGMLDVFNTINVNTIFSSVVVLFIYASFILAVTNGSFALIYALPDKIMRWLGGGSGASTDTHPLQEVKAAAEKSAGEVGAGLGESGKMALNKASTVTADKMDKSMEAFGGSGGKKDMARDAIRSALEGTRKRTNSAETNAKEAADEEAGTGKKPKWAGVSKKEIPDAPPPLPGDMPGDTPSGGGKTPFRFGDKKGGGTPPPPPEDEV